MNLLAKFFSVLLHPLLMPSYFVMVVFNSANLLSLMSPYFQFVTYTTIFVFTFLLPLLFMPFLLKIRYIHSFNMDSHKERLVPMIITFFCFLLCCIIMYTVLSTIPNIIKLYMVASSISILITLAITTKWKISAHMVGIGGNTGAVITLSLKMMSNIIPILLIIIILGGILASSRLQLKAHNAEQVYAGYGLGLAVVMLIIVFF